MQISQTALLFFRSGSALPKTGVGGLLRISAATLPFHTVRCPPGGFVGSGGVSVSRTASRAHKGDIGVGEGVGGGERARRGTVERNSPLAFSCSAFVWCYLAVPCYSYDTKKYKAAGSGSFPPFPLSSSSSLHRCIISNLNRRVRGRWKCNVHGSLTTPSLVVN